MPRLLSLGNGRLFLGFDAAYSIRDLFYPTVGGENHLNGHRIRMGVWVEGRFSWCDSEGWSRDIDIQERSQVSDVTLANDALAVRLRCRDAVDPLAPEYVRKIEVENLAEKDRKFKLFFTHDLRIDQSDVGDTAFFNPYLEAVVHYKGPKYFMFSASSQGSKLEYSTGIKDFNGFEGTWRDAEDGVLAGNPIAQGSVDSTIAIEVRANASSEAEAWYWLICGETIDEISERQEESLTRGLEHALMEAERYQVAWTGRANLPLLGELDENLRRLFFRSLHIMHAHIDKGGAILAALDTDIMITNRATYSYMWPRDGALSCVTLAELGFRPYALAFFRFCQRILSKRRPILGQKYNPDGSPGSSWHPWIYNGVPDQPFQEDETALVICAIWEYYAKYQELEVLGDLWRSFVQPTASFLEEFRDAEYGLPLPSYDLWEERRGIHTWTVCSVIKGLADAGKIAREVGESGYAATYEHASENMKDSLFRVCFDESRGVFYRNVQIDESGKVDPDLTIDASILSAVHWGILPAEDERTSSMIRAVEQALTIQSQVGGMARYESDYYFRVTDKYPGNPWIICTLWHARALITTAKEEADLARPLETLRWVASHAAKTGALSEQLHPETGEPLSVSPLTWSHSEYLATILTYLRALSKFRDRRKQS